MAAIIGEPGPEFSDQQVYDILKRFPEEWFIYAQPTIVYKGCPHHPDYVLIHQDIGVVVLEVKERANIHTVAPDHIVVYRHGRTEVEETPVKQVERHAHALVNKLQDNTLLRNHAGKLDFPYRLGVVFPFVPLPRIQEMRQHWGDVVIGPRDLSSPEKLIRAIRNLYIPRRRWKLPLSMRQIDAIRATVRPILMIKGKDGQFKGVYDPVQEQLSHEPLQRPEKPKAPSPEQRKLWLEEQMPDETRRLTQVAHVRLIRGYAGTGKTDVLVLRAFYLHDQYPDMQILVTTFNRPLVEKRLKPELDILERVDVYTFSALCKSIRDAKGLPWQKPQKTKGLLKKMSEDPNLQAIIEKYGVDFLEREIQWLKETGSPSRDIYRERPRRGLAQGGRRLTKQMKDEVYTVFEAYQQYLRDIPAFDWHDVHNGAYRYLQEGIAPPKKYDAILVDEAQHFAPAWMRVLEYFLQPGGHLFLCDDPSQGIYRNYSWRERGVEVVGRTRWLRIPYRNTRQISEALFALINSNKPLIQLLQDSGNFEPVDINHAALRKGEIPELHVFQTLTEEREFVAQRVNQLIEQGIVPAEIAVIHPEKYVRQKFRVHPGIQCVNPINQTGMEYRVVIIPHLDKYFQRNDINLSLAETRLKNLQRFFVAASRARDVLILSLSRKGRSRILPREIKPMLEKCQYKNHVQYSR